MSTIYVKTISAFDAANEHVITFDYSGNQCIKNRIIVYNSATNASVYDNTVTSYTLSHTIPSSTLTNGTSYYCTITAYYTSNNTEYSVVSSASNVWKCLTTAMWSINGISSGTVIGNSYYDFKMNYSQTQDEVVNEYYVVLYNQSGSTYWSSGTLYDISATTTATGLPNNTVLYARAYGTTVNGLSLDTGKIEVTVDYQVPNLYSVAYLENDKWHGWVKATVNILDVEGIGSGTYSFVSDKYVDLSSANSSVTFNKNFTLSGNFIVEALGYNVSANKSVITLGGDNLTAVATFRSGTFSSGTLFFAELKELNSGYVLYSNMIAIPPSTNQIHLWIKRKNGMYDCTIANMGVVS